MSFEGLSWWENRFWGGTLRGNCRRRRGSVGIQRLVPGGGPRGSLKEGCVLQKGVSSELPWGSGELVVSLEKGGWLRGDVGWGRAGHI